jgi:pSer/pThr/pTyr-binding forkhead associated (FHA) protein
LWIEDIGSTNGTIVNGKRIEHPVKLRKGDKVKVGETLFVVER